MKNHRALLGIVILVCINISALAQTDKDYKKFTKYINRDRADKVSTMISKGKNINSVDVYGRSPLLYSLEKDRLNITEVLLSAGADINITDLQKNGCLHYAIENCSNTDIVFRLLDLGADINLDNSDQYTPFHFSVLYKCPDLSFSFIERGVDYTKSTVEGMGPIHLAAVSGCESLVEHLLELGLDFDQVDLNGNTPLLLALENNRRTISKSLMDNGASFQVENVSHYTPVYYAVFHNDTTAFDRLLTQDVEVDIPVKKNTPIIVAANRENTYFVEKLLQNGAKNPMYCNIHDECYNSAFIYMVNAGIASDEEKQSLYQNSLNIFNLANEKYKSELNKIRAKNTAKVCGEVCLVMLGGYAVGADYEGERRDYLKNRIAKCEYQIAELERIVNPVE